MCGRPILIITRMITDRIRNPLVPLPLLIAQGSLDSAIFFQSTDLARDHPALIQRWLLPKLEKGFKPSTIMRFGIYGTVDKLFDRVSCINSFTETGERPWPTRLQGTSTRSDRGPLEHGDLNTLTIAAATLKEHDLIDKKHKSRKRGKFSTISLGSNKANTSRGWWK